MINNRRLLLLVGTAVAVTSLLIYYDVLPAAENIDQLARVVFVITIISLAIVGWTEVFTGSPARKTKTVMPQRSYRAGGAGRSSDDKTPPDMPSPPQDEIKARQKLKNVQSIETGADELKRRAASRANIEDRNVIS